MANHVKIKDPFNILLRISAENVGLLDKLALEKQLSRNDIINLAILLYVKNHK